MFLSESVVNGLEATGGSVSSRLLVLVVVTYLGPSLLWDSVGQSQCTWLQGQQA